ncbi:type II secretion system minor pseudopilin [Gemmatimonas sp.]
MALLAALWLVVIMATAGLQFSLIARERRALGVTASDRTRDRAALAGALAHVQARLDGQRRSQSAERQAGLAQRMGVVSDSWGNLDALFPDAIVVGETRVAVRGVDLGTVVNVNTASEQTLALLFEAELRDAEVATQLAQRILDWRDADTLSRANGAEGVDYRRAQRTILPANGNVRTVGDLAQVLGMTPNLLERLSPFLTTASSANRVNINAAPEPVLRTIPGMTPPLLAAILALRSGGRRVESVPALLTAVRGAARGDAASAAYMSQLRDLTEAVTLETREIELTLRVLSPSSIQPAQLAATIVRHTDGTAVVRRRQW